MPFLRSIAVVTRKRVVHGLSWAAVKMVLSIPQSEKEWFGRHLIYSTHVYEFPVLAGAEMLGIFQKCQLPHLTRLEIEYDADEEAQLDLLCSLPTMFPQLAWLQIHRHGPVRTNGGDVGSAAAQDNELAFVDVIGQALSTLSKLRTFCAYVDLPHQPTILHYGPFHYDSVDIGEYTKTLRRVACALAGTIPSLEIVYLWRPRDTEEIEWAPFEVVR
ncbi:hypothetical protein V8D89_001756 [Ganoderma adspersum]